MNLNELMHSNGYTLPNPSRNGDETTAMQDINDAVYRDTTVNPNSRVTNIARNMDQLPKAIHLTLSFAYMVTSELRGVIPIQQSNAPRVVGGKLSITINKEEYKKSLLQFRCCLSDRLVLMKGDKPIKVKDLKANISAVWGV